MVFDASVGRVVMFGGEDAFGTELADIWEWTGTNWVPRTTNTAPPPRAAHGMAYDSTRRRIVVFGGTSEQVREFEDTWTLTGGTWTELTPTVKPPARYACRLEYDARRDVTILVGGSATGSDFTDAWELRDAKWTKRVHDPLKPPPTSLFLLSTAYDLERGYVVTVGAETWRLGPIALAPRETCATGIDADHDTKAGCADDDCWTTCAPSCPPTLAPASCPMAPRCGDGECTASESCRWCPTDCAVNTAACPIVCGDNYCDSPETSSSCPGDC